MTEETETDAASDVEAWLDKIEADDSIEAEDASDLRMIGTALIGIEDAESSLIAAVEKARAGGRSWTEIANVLGVSRQAARQRFAGSVGV